MVAVANLVREARVKSGLSQKDVARKFGWTSAQFVSNIERGLVRVPADKTKAYAKTIGLSHSALVDAMISEYRKTLT
jgi:transcriptional regulator with XRE-family HTH domain